MFYLNRLAVFALFTSGCFASAPQEVTPYSNAPVQQEHGALECHNAETTPIFDSCQELENQVGAATCGSMQHICGKWNDLTGGAKNVFAECLVKLPSEDVCNPIEVNLCFLKVYTDLCETVASVNFCKVEGNVCSSLQDCTTQFNMYTEDALSSSGACFVDTDLACSEAINDCI